MCQTLIIDETCGGHVMCARTVCPKLTRPFTPQLLNKSLKQNQGKCYLSSLSFECSAACLPYIITVSMINFSVLEIIYSDLSLMLLHSRCTEILFTYKNLKFNSPSHGFTVLALGAILMPEKSRFIVRFFAGLRSENPAWARLPAAVRQKSPRTERPAEIDSNLPLKLIKTSFPYNYS